jgi:hypothetical protein
VGSCWLTRTAGSCGPTLALGPKTYKSERRSAPIEGRPNPTYTLRAGTFLDRTGFLAR